MLFGPLQVATTPSPAAAAGDRGRARNGGGAVVAAEPDNAVAEVLENTLWNRQLGVMSEEIVAALVCQIFEGAPPALTCHNSARATSGHRRLGAAVDLGSVALSRHGCCQCQPSPDVHSDEFAIY